VTGEGEKTSSASGGLAKKELIFNRPEEGRIRKNQIVSILLLKRDQVRSHADVKL